MKKTEGIINRRSLKGKRKGRTENKRKWSWAFKRALRDKRPDA